MILRRLGTFSRENKQLRRSHQPMRWLHAGSGTGRRTYRLQDQIFL